MYCVLYRVEFRGLNSDLCFISSSSMSLLSYNKTFVPFYDKMYTTYKLQLLRSNMICITGLCLHCICFRAHIVEITTNVAYVTIQVQGSVILSTNVTDVRLNSRQVKTVQRCKILVKTFHGIS